MVQPGKEVQRIERLAYFTGNAFYSLSKPDYTADELWQDMRRHKVDYLFSYNKPLDPQFLSRNNRRDSVVKMNLNIDGLEVYKMSY